MLGLKKFLFKGAAYQASDKARAELEIWRKSNAPAFDEVHFHTRYVIVDVTSSGSNPESDDLLGIAACSVQQATILPNDALFLDFNAPDANDATVDAKLLAFLKFSAKAPLVSYHVPYVGGFLQRIYKDRFGLDFQPQWIDLAWLLPSMFEEKGGGVMPLDHWIDSFGLDGGEGRRNAMDNTLMLARIFQMLLVRANGKEIDTAARLVDESKASSFLRRSH